MIVLTDNDFVKIVKKDALAVILVKTANCPKCKSIEEKIKKAGNPMDVLFYTAMNPGNEEANLILQNLKITTVPFILTIENGTVNNIETDFATIESKYANSNEVIV
jgi:glutaredoxin